MVPLILTYFQGHDLCKITFWAISQLLTGKMLPNFNTRWLVSGSFNGKKYFKQFEHEVYANALCWPQLCKKTLLTIIFELEHLG